MVVRSRKNSTTIGGLRKERNDETKKLDNKLPIQNNQSESKFKITDFFFEEPGYFSNNVEYIGVITKAEGKILNEVKFAVVTAELEDEKGKKGVFDKYFKLDISTNSLLYRFCKNMDALSKDKKQINVNALIDKEVIVTLFTNENDKTYISTIYPYIEEDETAEESIGDFDYDEDEEDGYIYED